MPISSRTVCAVLPVIPIALISANSTCVSVPPEITRIPRFCNSSDKTFSFFFTCFAYSLNAGERSSPKATAFAAMTCSNGPPCMPGKTALSIAFAYSSLHIIIPPRGPRRVLCVVVVTISAHGTGLGYSPPATSPAKCAISIISNAPTSCATAAILSKSIIRE